MPVTEQEIPAGWEIMWVQHPPRLTLMPFGASGWPRRIKCRWILP